MGRARGDYPLIFGSKLSPDFLVDYVIPLRHRESHTRMFVVPPFQATAGHGVGKVGAMAGESRGYHGGRCRGQGCPTSMDGEAEVGALGGGGSGVRRRVVERKCGRTGNEEDGHVG